MNNIIQSAETKSNLTPYVGIAFLNFISMYYKRFEHGLKKYMGHSEWKFEYKENLKDAKIILCMIDEMSIKYSSCIDKLTNTITTNQIVVFVNVRRYHDENLPEDSKQMDISSYLNDYDLKFNYTVINSFIPDSNVELMSPYISAQFDINYPETVPSNLWVIMDMFKEWLIAIVETNKEFLNIPRMMTVNEIEEYISISLGDINNNVSTLLERMMKDHTQKTEELIETTVGRILKEKFESISEKLQKKYETESSESNYDEIVKPINTEMEIVNDLEYVVQIIEKYNLNIYPNLTSLENISNWEIVHDHKFTDKDKEQISSMVKVAKYIDCNAMEPADKFFKDLLSEFGDYLPDGILYAYDSRTTKSINKTGATVLVDLFRLHTKGTHNGYYYGRLGWMATLHAVMAVAGFRFIK